MKTTSQRNIVNVFLLQRKIPPLSVESEGCECSRRRRARSLTSLLMLIVRYQMRKIESSGRNENELL